MFKVITEKTTIMNSIGEKLEEILNANATVGKLHSWNVIYLGHAALITVVYEV